MTAGRGPDADLLGRPVYGFPGPMPLDRVRDRGDGLKDVFGGGRIHDLHPVVFIERHHDLQSVHRIEPEAFRPEEGLIVADLVWADLEHEVARQEFFDGLSEGLGVAHQKIPPSILMAEPVR